MLDPNHDPNNLSGPRRSRHYALRSTVHHDEPWYRPLGDLGGRAPLVVATNAPTVDLGYEVRPYDRQLFIPVYAARMGFVTRCEETADGYAVEIDHLGAPWVTTYEHLSKVFVSKAKMHVRGPSGHVRSGDVIGYAAKSPIHIRFGLMRHRWDGQREPVDPMPHVGTWAEPPSPLNRKVA